MSVYVIECTVCWYAVCVCLLHVELWALSSNRMMLEVYVLNETDW